MCCWTLPGARDCRFAFSRWTQGGCPKRLHDAGDRAQRYGISVEVVTPTAETCAMVKNMAEPVPHCPELRRMCCNVRKSGRSTANSRSSTPGRAVCAGASRTRAACEGVGERRPSQTRARGGLERGEGERVHQEYDVPCIRYSSRLYQHRLRALHAAIWTRDERAGRWWWEENTKKECGIHSRDARTRVHLSVPRAHADPGDTMHEVHAVVHGLSGPARAHRPEYREAPACSRCQGGGAGRRRSPHLPVQRPRFSKEHRTKTSAASATCANCSPATGDRHRRRHFALRRCAMRCGAHSNFVEVYWSAR